MQQARQVDRLSHGPEGERGLDPNPSENPKKTLSTYTPISQRMDLFSVLLICGGILLIFFIFIIISIIKMIKWLIFFAFVFLIVAVGALWYYGYIP
jgi:hypothetical protein